MFGGPEKTCITCGQKHNSWLKNALAEFCLSCRNDLNVHFVSDAESLLAWLDDIPEVHRTMEAARVWRRTEPQQRGKGQIAAKAESKAESKEPTQEQKDAATRAMTEYGRIAGDAAPYTQPTTYVIDSTGLKEVFDTDVCSIVSVPKKVKGISTELKPGVHLKIPKVPYAILSATVAFFREVSAKSSCEAFIQVWWNRNEKKFHVHVPEQNVSGGSVQHSGNFDKEGARNEDGSPIWLYVMDIHSHGSSMGAFWSSVDDGDELRAPAGRMFGVIGNVKQAIPSWKWRVRTLGSSAGDGFIDLNVIDVFEIDAKKEVGFTVSWKVIFEVLQTAKNGSVNLDCPVDPFQEATFPKEWMEKVKGLSGWYHQGHQGTHHTSHHTGMRNDGTPEYLYIASGGELEEHVIESGGRVMKKTGRTLKLSKQDSATK